MNNFKEEAERRGYPQSDKTVFECTYWRLNNIFKEGADFGYQQGIADKQQYAAQEVTKVTSKQGVAGHLNEIEERLESLAIKSLESENESLKSRVKELEDTLIDLVQLKIWKDKQGKDEYYVRNVDKAWDEAKKVIAIFSGSEHLEQD